jgi:alpha-L-fucosidase
MTIGDHVRGFRPSDAAYAMYCYEHITDLINRYKPDVLWDDIEYPDFSKREGAYSLAAIFDHYYKTVPQGVINDRWGVPHSDYKTSEYQHSLDNESGAAWENCRGIGLSFGYNQIEDEKHYMSINAAQHHLIDIVSRGGNLLLNVGPTADGEIPAFQRKVLEGIGAWLDVNKSAIYASHPAEDVKSSDSPWVRWTANGKKRFAIIDATGAVEASGADTAAGASSAGADADAVAEASAAELFAGAAVDLLLREMSPPVGRPNMSWTIRAPETSSSGANRGSCCRAVCEVMWLLLARRRPPHFCQGRGKSPGASPG